MTVVYMNTDDIYQLFLKCNVPGVRKDAGRLWKGVNTGDAGVMGELLQAAYDPSAGQQALQAGEAAQQPGIAFGQQAMLCVMTTMTTSISTMMQNNNATMTTAISTMMQNNNAVMTALITKIEDRVASAEASTDAKIAEHQAATDAKMAEMMRVLKRVRTGAAIVAADSSPDSAEDAIVAPDSAPDPAQDAMGAPDSAPDSAAEKPAQPESSFLARGNIRAPAFAPALRLRKPTRGYIRYTAEAKKKTLQWLLEHSSHPFPTCDDVEFLRQATGIDTTKRMRSLICVIRTKQMEDQDGTWRAVN